MNEGVLAMIVVITIVTLFIAQWFNQIERQLEEIKKLLQSK